MKTAQIFKAILIGIFAGAVMFFAPFPFRFFFGFLFIFFALRFFAWGRWGKNYRYNDFAGNYFWNPSYTQRWRNMSDEERKSFIEKMERELFINKPVTE
jgi:hypothetical protein